VPPAVRLGAGPEGRDEGTTDIIISDITTPPDRDPTYKNIPPRYPPEAARRGQQGTVTLRLYIAPDGNVMSAEVAESSGFPLLDRAARDAVAHWRFRPAKLEGHAIPGSLLYRLVFQLG
jgi:protein TonB